MVWWAYSINEDCTTVRGFSLLIERLPKHGEITLDKVDRNIDRSFYGYRASARTVGRINRCLGKSVPVLSVFYTGKPGYSGFDDFSLVRKNPSGRNQRAVEIKVAVR